MKKTVSINLSGTLFNIDEDAYELLKNYLDKIAVFYAEEKDSGEIIEDIESRISELMSQRLSSAKNVLSIEDVKEIIKTMGEPFEFDERQDNKSKNYRTFGHKKHRKMYRDPDDRVLGGVCSGIGAYFNIENVFVRIFFIVFVFISFGTFLFAYFVLWIVVPEAKTAAQKLEMRGDPVNASSIGDFIKEEFENVKNNFKRKKSK